MSCQQNQQQCQPPPMCPSPKCPLKSSAQCLPPASSCCAPSPGGCGGPSSEGSCCLSHHRHGRSHRCRRQSSNSCDRGSGQQDGASSCGYGSGGCC
ncbi:PREDICTED: late cornified envelope protein 3B [Colobus angolensis palliatus]|uniref:late cornified envelope protein 3B n=1 Tax=Colobus angolensis palliatus TaxID=336983 RepID=UPI0005F5739A|nr:PREDICTED: late cornified envelope protein 3B [Colobus angolensis palliatus]